MGGELGKGFWEERWAHAFRTHPAALRERAPNRHLVAEAGKLTPGTALDAGCGHGADTIWLASRGWRVTAVDVAAAALRGAQEHADTLGAEIASRIEWQEADLSDWTPPEGHFDLVSSHFVHGVEPHDDLVRRLAAAVAPGGTLLVVGHHPSDPHTAAHADAAQLSFTAEEAAACLECEQWGVVVAETRSRPDHESIGRDAVLCARRRR